MSPFLQKGMSDLNLTIYLIKNMQRQKSFMHLMAGMINSIWLDSSCYYILPVCGGEGYIWASTQEFQFSS